MKKGINLAASRKRVDSIFKKAFVTSVVFFILVVVISLGLIIYRLVLSGWYDALDQKEQQLNQQLLVLVDKKDKFIETKSRIGDAKKIISNRSPVTARIETLTSALPTDSSIKALSGDDEKISVSIESENLLSLNDLVEQKLVEIADDKKRGIKKVDMKSFVLNPKTLQYSVFFEVTFN